MAVVNFGKVAATPTPREMEEGGTHQIQLSNGNIVQVWIDDGRRNGAVDETKAEVWARVFNSDGTPLASNPTEFIVTQWDAPAGVTSDSFHTLFENVSVSEAADGGFNVIWHSYGQSNHPDYAQVPGRNTNDVSRDLVTRAFNADGTPDAAAPNERIIEVWENSNEWNDSVSSTNTLLLDNGNTLISWVEESEATGIETFKTMLFDQDMNPITGSNGGEQEHFPLGTTPWIGHPGGIPFAAMHETDQIDLGNGKVMFLATGREHDISTFTDWNNNESFAWVIDTTTGQMTTNPVQVTPEQGGGIAYEYVGSDVDSDGNIVVFSIRQSSNQLYKQVLSPEGVKIGGQVGVGSLHYADAPAGQAFHGQSIAVTLDASDNVVAMYTTYKSSQSESHPGSIFSRVFPADGSEPITTLEYSGIELGHPEHGEIFQNSDGTFVYGFSAGTGATEVQNRWFGTFDIAGTTAPPAPCFVRGTEITTMQGQKKIEEIRVGDMVLTMDHGFQQVRWVGSRTVRASNNLAPVLISANALNNSKDLLVSPQHRMYIQGNEIELMFGSSEVLVSAKSLVNDKSIRRVECGQVEYFHILFDCHEVIFAHGCPTESFHPGEMGFSGLDKAARDELCLIFPEFLSGDFAGYGASVRRSLKPSEAQALHG